MKRFAVCMLLCSLILSTTSFATIVERGEVMYTGGTLANVKEGTMGRLDTTSDTALTFDAGGTKVVIPYARIKEFHYSEELARHLGVVPTIAVVMVKHRQRRHFFRITFNDERDVQQVAVLEVSKEMPRTLRAILQARAPHLCQAENPCGWHS